MFSRPLQIICLWIIRVLRYVVGIMAASTMMHTGEEPHEGGECMEEQSCLRNLNTQRCIHFEEKPYVDEICKKNFFRISDLNERICSLSSRHGSIHTRKRKHASGLCTSYYSIISSFTKEIHTLLKEMPSKLAKGDICMNQCPRTSELHEPKRNRAGEKPHECEICMRQFSQKNDLNLHRRIHTEEKPLEYEIRTKENTYYLKEHILIYTAEKSQKCKQISQKYVLNENSSMHLGEELRKGELCIKHFRKLPSLEESRPIHTEETPYECEICKKKFSMITSFNAHTSFHTGKKPHECNICMKRFYLISSLKEHRLIHTEEYPYECEICKKKFSMIRSLNIHTSFHTGKKPYECDICMKQFYLITSLKKHRRSHTGAKPHELELCVEQFYQRYVLNKHGCTLMRDRPLECELLLSPTKTPTNSPAEEDRYFSILQQQVKYIATTLNIQRLFEKE